MYRRSAFRLAVAVLPLGLVAACAGAPDHGRPPKAIAALSAPGQTGAQAAPAEAGGPAVLRGLSPAEVKAVLGAPGFQRRDAPAEIWQYRGRGCTLDLFIYDVGAGQKVDHYSVRSAAPVADKDCFDALVAERRALSGS